MDGSDGKVVTFGLESSIISGPGQREFLAFRGNPERGSLVGVSPEGDYDVTLLFAFAILMATSAGTDGFVLIWTLDYTTPTPYYTTSYAAPSYSTKALEYYTTYAAPSYYTESPNYLVYYTTRTPKYYTTIYSAPTYYTQAIKYYAAQRTNAGKLMKTKPKSCLEFFEIHLNLTPEKDLPLIRNRTGNLLVLHADVVHVNAIWILGFGLVRNIWIFRGPQAARFFGRVSD
ncbi:hypothetical protein OUZ56_024546 [Daphnia magna]|uniref:Uncharacterized protein n=1 Tax=Daphnia magna TaxID=35525 RepID=A0ABR0B127_9CRUS|nr:hypothetical protein OUZ56_024546 [Daphnia magna]